MRIAQISFVALAFAISTPAAPAISAASATSVWGGSAETVARPLPWYDRYVLADRPVALLQGTTDLTGNGHHGIAVGAPATTRLPNGEPTLVFDGAGQYVEVPDSPAFSVPTTGVLTVEFWMRPDTLQFPSQEGSGYVKVLGKGGPSRYEWYGRMYSASNTEGRPNRISGYIFNPPGGLGAGSYFQDPAVAHRWIHVAIVYNTRDTSSSYPTGYTKIYKNGQLRDQDALADYGIVPRDGADPLRVGTSDRGSFFLGAVGKVAIYDHEVTGSRLKIHHRAMFLR